MKKRRHEFYILEGKTPVAATRDVWAQWLEAATRDRSRVVAQTMVEKGVEVSTVFLGLDHNYSPVGPPILFETLVFGGPRDGDGRRYATWAEAEVGHMEFVEQMDESTVTLR